MNSFESNLLELEGIKRENLKIFYAGYDHNIFYPLYLKDKKFDVVFVCKYDSILESYYSRRKNYTMLINLVNSLSKSLKIAIIGKDWDKCQSLSKSENIFTLNPKHSSKTFLTTSHSQMILRFIAGERPLTTFFSS